MDLQVYLIIVTVFFVSLGSLLFINRQLRGGKTFEEALAEKRQLAEKLNATNKKKNASKKSNANKKNRGGKNAQDAKQQQQQQQQQQQKHSAVESDIKTDSGSENDENASSASTASNENAPKIHVEFTEAEIIATDTNTVFKRQLSNGKPQPVRKTSASKSPGSGILVNKSTVNTKPAPPTNGSIETLNHFEKSHPKDDLEIKKQRDESTGRSANGAASKKENKKGGNKQSKKDASPAQTVAVAERKADVVDALLSVPTETAVAVAVPVAKESPRNAPNKEKVSKKKRNEALLIQQLVDAGVAAAGGSEAVNVNAIMQQLGRTELTRNEIQILIDFLLNKQQDTANVIHSDWSDDPLHKLRKQIEDKDRLLAEEQSAALAIQTKLRELRADYNAERAQAVHRHNAHTDEVNALKANLQQAQQEHQHIVDRVGLEKSALNKQIQHLQQQFALLQEKDAQAEESVQQIQQLTEAKATLSAELLAKNLQIQDLQDKFVQLREELVAKVTEYEQANARHADEIARLNGEVQRLHNECQRQEEIETAFSAAKYELDQLQVCVAEQKKQSTQIEDTSKVEIRNLQNALDSTKTELTQSRTELVDSAKRIGDLGSQLDELRSSHDQESTNVAQNYTRQIDELNSTIQTYCVTISEKDAKLNELQTKLESSAADQREQELFKQIAEHKEKNNELRKKNWKLVDALQKAEESASKISSKCKLVTTNTSLSPSKIPTTPANNSSEQEEFVRTKQVFERLFPDIPSKNVEYDAWLNSLSSHIEHLQQQEQQHTTNQQHSIKRKSTIDANNHQNGADDDADDDNSSDENITGNGTHHYGQDNGLKLSPSTGEELVLQNAQLKSTVDEYKLIVAETDAVLNTLEKKVKEQDAYWRDIVQLKDNEIRLLQSSDVAST